MQFSTKKYLTYIFFLFATVVSAENKASAIDDNIIKSFGNIQDTTNYYNQLLNDDSDDLMESHPAEDIYMNIWTSEKLNPYKFPVDSLHDSIRIDCSNFVHPIMGGITSEFGPRRYRYHYGIDLRLNTGDPIVAAFKGKIRIIDFEQKGYGHYVVIRHDNGLETVYAHLSKVNVELNQDVNAGDTIALGGNTGHSTGPHLHFETRYIGNAINPALIIDFEKGEVIASTYLILKDQAFAYKKVTQQIALAKTMAKYIKVRKGDNLGRLAINNNTSITSICKLNRISQRSLLKVGQKIRIR